jgi:hypothetical protein
MPSQHHTEHSRANGAKTRGPATGHAHETPSSSSSQSHAPEKLLNSGYEPKTASQHQELA